MPNGPFVDNIVLNDTILPDDPNSITVANTRLEDSRVRRCLIELDSMFDDGAGTTVGAVLNSLSNAEDNIVALTGGKADAAAVSAMALTVNTLQTSFDTHDQDADEHRHINTVAGTDNHYSAYDSTKTNGTTNVWKPLPAATSAPLTYEGKTTSFTAVKDFFYNLPLTAAATVTLPATPTVGDEFLLRLSNASATNIVTLARNGENVEGVADNGTLIKNGTHLIKFVGTIGGVNVGWISYAGLRA